MTLKGLISVMLVVGVWSPTNARSQIIAEIGYIYTPVRQAFFTDGSGDFQDYQHYHLRLDRPLFSFSVALASMMKTTDHWFLNYDGLKYEVNAWSLGAELGYLQVYPTSGIAGFHYERAFTSWGLNFTLKPEDFGVTVSHRTFYPDQPHKQQIDAGLFQIRTDPYSLTSLALQFANQDSSFSLGVKAGIYQMGNIHYEFPQFASSEGVDDFLFIGANLQFPLGEFMSIKCKYIKTQLGEENQRQVYTVTSVRTLEGGFDAIWVVWGIRLLPG